jgi:hypothetical protein
MRADQNTSAVETKMIEAIVLGPPHDSRRATTRDSVHDSYICAAYILTKLKAAQGVLQGMSYWAVDRPEVDRNVEIGRDGVFRVRVSMATRN